MSLQPGDHVCAIYDSEGDLADIVGDFLADGLRNGERCWYLPASDDPRAVRAALRSRRIDPARAGSRGALRILSSNAAYGVRGGFDPEESMAVFNNAIEDALADGFNGFRAAANMSWALDLEDGPERLITDEAGAAIVVLERPGQRVVPLRSPPDAARGRRRRAVHASGRARALRLRP